MNKTKTITIQRGDLDIDVDVNYDFHGGDFDYISPEIFGTSSEGEKVELTKEEMYEVERELVNTDVRKLI